MSVEAGMTAITCPQLNAPMGLAFGRKMEIYARNGFICNWHLISIQVYCFIRYGAAGAVLDGVAYGLQLHFNYLISITLILFLFFQIPNN